MSHKTLLAMPLPARGRIAINFLLCLLSALSQSVSPAAFCQDAITARRVLTPLVTKNSAVKKPPEDRFKIALPIKKNSPWWMELADTNYDRTIDESELAQWKRLEAAQIDTNKDGSIGPNEKFFYIRHMRRQAGTEEEKKYDIDRDGYFSEYEFKKMLVLKRRLSKNTFNVPPPERSGQPK